MVQIKVYYGLPLKASTKAFHRSCSFIRKIVVSYGIH